MTTDLENDSLSLENGHDNDRLIFVPENLPPGSNILNQPPYTWFAVSGTVPDDFFIPPEGAEEINRIKDNEEDFMDEPMALFLRALAVTDEDKWRKINGGKSIPLELLKGHINPKYTGEKKDAYGKPNMMPLIEVVRKSKAYLDEFPGSLEYLTGRWDTKQKLIDPYGEIDHDSRWKVESYAATASRLSNINSRKQQTLGLGGETKHMRGGKFARVTPTDGGYEMYKPD